MKFPFLDLLSELPASTTAFILLAGVICTLAKQGCFPALSQRQFFFLIMTFSGIIGFKALIG